MALLASALIHAWLFSLGASPSRRTANSQATQPHPTNSPPRAFSRHSQRITFKTITQPPEKVVKEQINKTPPPKRKRGGDAVKPKPQKIAKAKAKAKALTSKKPSPPGQAILAGNKPPSALDKSIGRTHLDKSTDSLRELVRTNDDLWVLAKSGCSRWYGGVGVGISPDAEEYQGQNTEVREVYPGYAAQAAGVLAGDILTADGGFLRGPPGSLVLVHVRRQGSAFAPEENFAVTIVREKICLEGNGRIITNPYY